MKNKGIIIHATEYAKNNHKQKKKNKKIFCPSCELKIMTKAKEIAYVEDTSNTSLFDVKKEILKDNN